MRVIDYGAPRNAGAPNKHGGHMEYVNMQWICEPVHLSNAEVDPVDDAFHPSMEEGEMLGSNGLDRLAARLPTSTCTLPTSSPSYAPNCS